MYTVIQDRVAYFILFWDGCIFSEMHISFSDLFHIQNTWNKTSRLHSRPRAENENWSAQENQCTDFKHMRNIYARSDAPAVVNFKSLG